MAIRDALLAILAQGPCYGNQLKHEYDRRTAGAWPLNVGQIYTTLDRLERDGLVSAALPNDQGQTIYELTPSGRDEVTRWFARPLDDPLPRDELATKIALAVSLAGVDALEVITHQQRSTQQRLAELRATRGDRAPADGPDGTTTAGSRDSGAADGTSLAVQLILEAHIGAVTAEAVWLDFAEQRIRALGPDSGVISLETEPPRRGRPRQS
jgi:DNA-binding PadR family transcriptional regulator